jgi:hypothetical protein
MKRLLFFGLAFMACSLVQAQQEDEAVFSEINNIGGFGGPFIEVSTINGETVADVGGGGAVILNNFFLGGYGLGNKFAGVELQDEAGNTDRYEIQYGNGGLWFGYVYPSYKLAHIYASLRLGWGSTTLQPVNDSRLPQYKENLFVTTPEVGVELNLTRFMRVAFSGGYRFVDGLDDLPAPLNNDDFSGPIGMITFRFGGFGDWDEEDWN